MRIHEEIYEGHLIRANSNAAMIFLNGSKNLETKFHAMDLEDALKKSKAWIDEKLVGRRETRRAANIGTIAGYIEVFKVIKFSKARRLMLVAHCRAETVNWRPANSQKPPDGKPPHPRQPITANSAKKSQSALT